MTDLSNDPCNAPVHVLSGWLERQQLTSSELVDACLTRIQRNEQLGAFVSVYEREAREAATAADGATRAGHRVGPFHGIPIAIKDLIDIEGKVTTGGSKYFAERISPVTATLVRRLIGAGMIVIGKTHTVEFAMGGWGTNRQMGTPRNPWDPNTHRAPGGSSSGTGVAVSAGLAPWGIGTDTGGSVRLPSSWCGLTGLKTTIGRISVHGVQPLSPSLDTPGPLCRCARDAAALFDVLQGPDPLDRTTTLRPLSQPTRSLTAGVRGLRLARMPQAEREGVDDDMLAAYDQAVETFESLGADVVDLKLPVQFDEMKVLLGKIIAAEGYALYGELIDDPALPLDDDVRPRLSPGRDISAKQYLQALHERQRLMRVFDEALSGVDALLTPTTESAAPAIDEIDQSSTPARFTRAVNILDYCAVAMPNGFTTGGLPLSFQVICRGYEEEMALRIGHAYQRATDWHTRRPAGLG